MTSKNSLRHQTVLQLAIPLPQPPGSCGLGPCHYTQHTFLAEIEFIFTSPLPCTTYYDVTINCSSADFMFVFSHRHLATFQGNAHRTDNVQSASDVLSVGSFTSLYSVWKEILNRRQQTKSAILVNHTFNLLL